MVQKSGISQNGRFVYGIHKPSFRIRNLRENEFIAALGRHENGTEVSNQNNFPGDDVTESGADWIFEIPNAFPFRGATYITKSWADEKSQNPSLISLPEQPQVSLTDSLKKLLRKSDREALSLENILEIFPEPLLLALATTSTDAADLVQLAKESCTFIFDNSTGRPIGLKYLGQKDHRPVAQVKDPVLFEAVANNPHLPDEYKEVMVLKPGVQGGSEIIGEWTDESHQTHIFEYLRRNSYIPWGHFAANLANDSIRYQISSLTMTDMTGLRHLYYQRTYARLAEQLDMPVNQSRRSLTVKELENVRSGIREKLDLQKVQKNLKFNGSLWGWNFGYDFAPTQYRLHASHQQIHQQFAMIPTEVVQSTGTEESSGHPLQSYASGDLIADFISEYKTQTGDPFFDNYIKAIRSNVRMDGIEGAEKSLIVYEDQHIIVFVPKAQTSQWELQLMLLNPVGNIVEASTSVRKSIDRGIFIAVQVLSALGAKLVTSIEFSKRIDDPDKDQRLLYAFMPKLPESPGAFSEAQLRWINGHYPEDFATACRLKLSEIDFDFSAQ